MKNYGAFFVALLMATTLVSAADEGTSAETAGSDFGAKFLGAGIAVGLAAIGAGYAIAKVGTASVGAIVENQKLFGNTILYVAFSEALAIYGLLVALLIVIG